jgi:hypothetical protein
MRRFGCGWSLAFSNPRTRMPFGRGFLGLLALQGKGVNEKILLFKGGQHMLL